jgi:hypothetical protein
MAHKNDYACRITHLSVQKIKKEKKKDNKISKEISSLLIRTYYTLPI